MAQDGKYRVQCDKWRQETGGSLHTATLQARQFEGWRITGRYDEKSHRQQAVCGD